MLVLKASGNWQIYNQISNLNIKNKSNTWKCKNQPLLPWILRPIWKKKRIPKGTIFSTTREEASLRKCLSSPSNSTKTFSSASMTKGITRSFNTPQILKISGLVTLQNSYLPIKRKLTKTLDNSKALRTSMTNWARHPKLSFLRKDSAILLPILRKISLPPQR